MNKEQMLDEWLENPNKPVTREEFYYWMRILKKELSKVEDEAA